VHANQIKYQSPKVIGNSNLSQTPKVANQWKLQSRMQGRMTPNVFQGQKLQRNTQTTSCMGGWVKRKQGFDKARSLIKMVKIKFCLPQGQVKNSDNDIK